jgi:hypothetical protein
VKQYSQLDAGGATLSNTALKRQKDREDKAIREAISRMPIKVREPVTPEKLAPFQRHMETIAQAERTDPDTGEIIIVEKTKRAVTLLDKMHEEGLLSMDEWRAGVTLRELYFTAQGPSSGVSSYGEYTQATEPSGRIPVSQAQLKASFEFEEALEEAVGVRRKDGKATRDEQLQDILMKTILNDKKDINQAWVGATRTLYQNQVQQRPAGGAVVHEVLQRLVLYFGFRER